MEAMVALPSLESNPYFSAGFGLGILGTGLAALRGGARAALTLAQRHLLVTLEVTSKDKAYPWVLHWMTHQARGGALAQHLTVDTVSHRLANGTTKTSFEFTPCPGRHVLKYRGHFLMVDRQREQQTVDLHTGQPWENVKITAFGRRRELFEEFLREAQAFAQAKQELSTTIFTNWGTEWRPFGSPRRRRPLHSVVLDDGVAEHIIADVRSFVSSSQWYIDRGIPYRRGYLMYGAPGCGKSSFVAALAGELGYDICVLNLSDAGLTDDRLAHALSTTPPQSLVLLEDVDAAFVERDPKDRRSSHVTFSGLLNALDGVAAGEERTVFMTTNHLERLDPALIRPGRVDVIHHIGPASASQARRMFLKFFPDEATLAEEFVAELRSHDVEISMAVLQSYFMLYRSSAAQARQNASELCLGIKDTIPVQQQMAEAHMQGQARWNQVESPPASAAPLAEGALHDNEVGAGHAGSSGPNESPTSSRSPS
ncbi:hypothetical protein AB1Y20_018463 [Prymnesium parvum]|uniref:Mitochondrial chaperone BCS1 n=1 Tax=Prymnesium parvum TaxID=97485 RepID=A0AB34JQ01_PRYPA